MPLLSLFDMIKDKFVPSVAKGDATTSATHLLSIASPGKVPFKSIASRAADTICFYPLLVSESLDVKQMATLARATERRFAEFIRIILSNDDVIDLRKTSKQDVINQFRGIDLGTDTEWHKANAVRGTLQGAAESVAILIDHGARAVTEDNTPMDDGLNHHPLSEAKTAPPAGTAPPSKPEKITMGISAKAADKKMSDLSPLLMPVSQTYTTDSGQPIETNIMIAVKANVHIIPSAEMVSNVGASMRDDRFIFRLVQWTTGEISFWKDFVLNIDKLKADVKKDDKSGRWFWQLKAMAQNSAVALAFQKRHMVPTTTIVLSYAEMEEIRRVYNVDLMDPREAIRFQKLFHLIGFMIVDPSTETLWAFDGVEKRYDRTTLPSEERDNASFSPKDVLKIMSGAINAGGAR
jgi:hypothetical protein